jgi:predicted RNase H-like nuclease
VLATIRPGGIDVQVLGGFADAATRVDRGELVAVAVDMPIGLPDSAPRQADQEARRRLGVRRASVFPTPVRDALGAADYPEALAISRRVCGKGLSKQAFNLLARMAEVDRVMTPARQDRIVECHPELTFAVLAGSPLEYSKHTPAGIDERLGLLAAALGAGRDQQLEDLVRARRRGAGPDDVVDALAIALVAEAVASGDPTVEHLGDGARDRRGLRMEIVTRSGPGLVEVPCND